MSCDWLSFRSVPYSFCVFALLVTGIGSSIANLQSPHPIFQFRFVLDRTIFTALEGVFVTSGNALVATGSDRALPL